MTLTKQARLLRIFLGEQDSQDGRPLYEVIVERAHQEGLAGATVFRGSMGFGASSRMHSAKILRLSEDLPIVVEIVDTAAHLRNFVKLLDGLMGSGLVTLEKADVHLYRPKQRAPRKR